MTNLDSPLTTADLRPRAMLNAYFLFFNFYADEPFASLDDFLAFPDIAATLTIAPIDYYRNALHIYFDYDTCQINLIATFNADDCMTSILLSTDTMPYESMILDLARRA